MEQYSQSKYGVFAFDDSGVPKSNGVESTDYTTVVILHGFVFHKAGFGRMLKYAEKNNSRLVLVNRRDYPGSDPYTEQERKLLLSEGEEDSTINTNMQEWMKHRSEELYQFLALFSKNEHIPAYMPSTKTGGIVIAGWSLGTSFMTATLANMKNFPQVQEGIDMKQYLRRVVFYDTPYHTFGYPPLLTPETYDPLLYPESPNQTPEEHGQSFATWVSGYYDHDAISSISDLKINSRPEEDSLRPPTISVMPKEFQERAIYLPAGFPSGSDAVLLIRGIKYGLYNSLRLRALYLNEMSKLTMGDEANNNIDVVLKSDEWSHLEIVHVLCKSSAWVMPYGLLELKAELASAKEQGKQTRNIRFERLEGLNHLAHWDDPEATLKSFLSNAEND